MATEIYASTAYQKIQYGLENVPGSALAATVVAQGGRLTTFPLGDHIYETFEDETTGLLVPHVTAPVKVKTEANFVWEGALNTVDGKIALNMALTREASGAWQPVWGSPGNAPRASNGSYVGISPYTFEYGDDVKAYETAYCFGRRLQIVGRPNELIKFTLDITGRACTETDFTPDLSRGAAYYFPFELTKFYIDTTYASLGTTQKTGVLRGFTWTYTPAFAPMYAADGAAYFSKVLEGKRDKKVALGLILARDNTHSEAIFDAYQAQTIQRLRVKLVSTTGTSFTLDGAYRYVDWGLGDEEGLAVCNVPAETVYDSGGTNSFEVNYA